MKKCVLEMLEISSGIPSKDLFEKVDFRVMDSTSHNFHVDEKVSLKTLGDLIVLLGITKVGVKIGLKQSK